MILKYQKEKMGQAWSGLVWLRAGTNDGVS
jgi:hypothetical protein